MLVRSGAPLLCALLAASALHLSLCWAWPHSGVSGQGANLMPVAHAFTSTGPMVTRALMQVEHHAGTSQASGVEDKSPRQEAQARPEHVNHVPPPSAGGEALLAASYLDVDQADVTPRPIHGWFLDEELLAEVGRARVLLKIWVSASGRIDHAEVLLTEPPGDWAVRALKPLLGTPMAPAQKDGQAVAVVTVVELQAENEQVR